METLLDIIETLNGYHLFKHFEQLLEIMQGQQNSSQNLETIPYFTINFCVTIVFSLTQMKRIM